MRHRSGGRDIEEGGVEFVFGERIRVEGVEEGVSFYATVFLAVLITGFSY